MCGGGECITRCGTGQRSASQVSVSDTFWRDGYDPRMGKQPYGPWHPGIQSQVPKELWHLSTIFRPENVFTSISAAHELQGLTGFSPSELVAFRPQRLEIGRAHV